MTYLDCEGGIKGYSEFWFWHKEALFCIFLIDSFGSKLVESKIQESLSFSWAFYAKDSWSSGQIGVYFIIKTCEYSLASEYSSFQTL